MSVGNTSYPTTLDTAADLVEAANRSSSTLSAGIDNNPATTTIPLVSSSTFTTSGIVAIDDEIISYTGKSGNSLTGAVRAFEGTTIASHSVGAAVRQLITAASHNVQSAAIIALETKLGTGTDIAWTQMTPLTANRIAVTDGTGDIAASPITHDGTNAIVGNVGAIDFDDSPTVTAGAPSLGRLTWNDGEGTLNLTLKGGNVTVPLSQKDTARVVNGSGTNLLSSNYQVVRITTPQGQRIGVTLAQANNETNSADVLGLISENINNNNTGTVTTRGVVSGINTTGSLQGETWVAGDVLFLSPTTAGGLTKVKPVSPDHLILVGYVVYAHATEGKLFVAIQTSWEVEELHDVKITGTPAAGSLLIRNATNSIWENATLTAGSNISITNADKSITIAATGIGTGDVTGPASSTATAIARFSDTTGKIIQNSLIGIDGAGALGLPDNVRQTFNPGSTTPGLNVGANSGDPSAPSNGDIWYNSATTGTGNRQFRIRRNGVTSSVAIVPPSVTAEREIPTINPSTENLDNVGELFYVSADNAIKIGDAGTGRLQLNAITTETPQVQVTGVDTNIGLNLVSKGTGTVQANGVPVVTTSGSQAITNKTINGSNNTITNVSLTTGVTGTLPIANGGTGTTTLPNNGLLLGGNTSIQSLAHPGAPDKILISTPFAWQTIPAPSSIALQGGQIILNTFSDYQVILTDNSSPTQSVTLPNATTFIVGRGFSIYNLSATLGVLFLSDGTYVRNIAQGVRIQVVCVSTASNVAGSWAITQESGGVTSLSAGTTGLTPSSGTAGDVVLGGTLSITNGGTGQATRQGAINALAGSVTSGQYLRGNGTNIAMSAIQAGDVPTLNQNTTGTAANVTGVVALANGGTGQTTYTAGQLLIGNNSGGLTKATLTAGSNVTITNGDGAITIAATGGSGGVTSFSAGTTGLTPNTTTTGAVTLAGTLGVANGGTGAASLAANNVLLGNGTSAVQVVAPGTSGNVLTSNGTTWQSAPGTQGILRTDLQSTTLTASSPTNIFLLGSSAGAQNIDLPDATTLTVGRSFVITCESNPGGVISVAATALAQIHANQKVVCTCVSVAANVASSWTVTYDNFFTNPAGAENYIVNSAFRVDQRNASASRTLTTGSFQFVADRWEARALTQNVTVSFTPATQAGGIVFTGAGGNTGVELRQRIEQSVMNGLQNTSPTGLKTVVLSCRITATNINPVICSYTVSVPVVADNFSSVDVVGSGSIPNVGSGVPLRSISPPIIVFNSRGIELVLTTPAIPAGSTLTISNVKLEPGSFATPYVSVPYDLELARCQLNLNVRSQAGSTYTFALNDINQLIDSSAASPTLVTFSIPTNSNVAFPVGSQIHVVQTGAGSGRVAIQAVTPGTTTVNSTGANAASPKLRTQYSAATCIKTASDTWLVIGDII